MSRAICTRCGGRRIPIVGWPFGNVHPFCLPDHIQVWPRAEQLAWLAQREATKTTVSGAQRAQDATKGSNR